jgi:hypothetical protein
VCRRQIVVRQYIGIRAHLREQTGTARIVGEQLAAHSGFWRALSVDFAQTAACAGWLGTHPNAPTRHEGDGLGFDCRKSRELTEWCEAAVPRFGKGRTYFVDQYQDLTGFLGGVDDFLQVLDIPEQTLIEHGPTDVTDR